MTDLIGLQAHFNELDFACDLDPGTPGGFLIYLFIYLGGGVHLGWKCLGEQVNLYGSAFWFIGGGPSPKTGLGEGLTYVPHPLFLSKCILQKLSLDIA